MDQGFNENFGVHALVKVELKVALRWLYMAYFVHKEAIWVSRFNDYNRNVEWEWLMETNSEDDYHSMQDDDEKRRSGTQNLTLLTRGQSCNR